MPNDITQIKTHIADLKWTRKNAIGCDDALYDHFYKDVPALLDELAAKDAEIELLTAALRKTDGECDNCNHNHGGECENADFDCMTCEYNCTCKTCRDNSNWQWHRVRTKNSTNIKSLGITQTSIL